MPLKLSPWVVLPDRNCLEIDLCVLRLHSILHATESPCLYSIHPNTLPQRPPVIPELPAQTQLPGASCPRRCTSIAHSPAAMAPTGPRSSTIQRRPSPAPVVEDFPPPRGPNPGNISISNQYKFEQNIRRLQKEYGCDPAREDSYRIQGVQLIESVRQALRL